MGQYESYQFFTLPGKYQVTGGVNILAPKFNVIPPGVDEDKYFPYHEKERRINNKCRQWDERIFSEESDGVVGHLADPDKWPIFTMARLDKIKNITGLIEAYGMSDKLKENCNLIVAAGATRVEESGDEEEKSEIEKVYRLLDQYNLHDHIRWIPLQPQVGHGSSIPGGGRPQGSVCPARAVRGVRAYNPRGDGQRPAHVRAQVRRSARNYRGGQKRVPDEHQ